MIMQTSATKLFRKNLSEAGILDLVPITKLKASLVLFNCPHSPWYQNLENPVMWSTEVQAVQGGHLTK